MSESEKRLRDALEALRAVPQSEKRNADDLVLSCYRFVELLPQRRLRELRRRSRVLHEVFSSEEFEDRRQAVIAEIESAFHQFREIWTSEFFWDHTRQQLAQVIEATDCRHWTERDSAGKIRRYNEPGFTMQLRPAAGEPYVRTVSHRGESLSDIRSELDDPKTLWVQHIDRERMHWRQRRLQELLTSAGSETDRIRDWIEELTRLDLLERQDRVTGSEALLRCHSAWVRAMDRKDSGDLEELCRDLTARIETTPNHFASSLMSVWYPAILSAAEDLSIWNSRQSETTKKKSATAVNEPHDPPPALTNWSEMGIGILAHSGLKWEFFAFIPCPDDDERVAISNGTLLDIPQRQLQKALALFATSKHGNRVRKSELELCFDLDAKKKVPPLLSARMADLGSKLRKLMKMPAGKGPVFDGTTDSNVYISAFSVRFLDNDGEDHYRFKRLDAPVDT